MYIYISIQVKYKLFTGIVRRYKNQTHNALFGLLLVLLRVMAGRVIIMYKEKKYIPLSTLQDTLLYTTTVWSLSDSHCSGTDVTNIYDNLLPPVVGKIDREAWCIGGTRNIYDRKRITYKSNLEKKKKKKKKRTGVRISSWIAFWHG